MEHFNFNFAKLKIRAKLTIYGQLKIFGQLNIYAKLKIYGQLNIYGMMHCAQTTCTGGTSLVRVAAIFNTIWRRE